MGVGFQSEKNMDRESSDQEETSDDEFDVSPALSESCFGEDVALSKLLA